MNTIIRKKYLDSLQARMNNGLIKVITGVRRSGKSYLLFNLFYKFLKDSGIKDECIITLALDDDINEKYREPSELSKYIRSLVKETEKTYYILLDEIQLAISDEEYAKPEMPKKIFSVLNGFLHLNNVDIYVTGSNSKFLSSDVLTEFRGRGDEIHVLPFSFSEYLQGYSGDVYHAWADYVMYGGLPLVLGMKTDEQKASYLMNLFEETYLKDIIAHNKIEKTQELEDLINIISSSIGSLTNPKKIADTFVSNKKKISQETIKKYLEYLSDSFLVSASYRYDIKGKRYIDTPLKYYFSDIGLRNARLNFRQMEETHIMENIIYNELVNRGYNVDVGVVQISERNKEGKACRVQYEIDFVVNKGFKRYYIQSAFALPDSEKVLQEERPFLKISDSFKKIIIEKTNIHSYYTEEGILVISVYDFLLNENSLEA